MNTGLDLFSNIKVRLSNVVFNSDQSVYTLLTKTHCMIQNWTGNIFISLGKCTCRYKPRDFQKRKQRLRFLQYILMVQEFGICVLHWSSREGPFFFYHFQDSWCQENLESLIAGWIYEGLELNCFQTVPLEFSCS